MAESKATLEREINMLRMQSEGSLSIDHVDAMAKEDREATHRAAVARLEELIRRQSREEI